MDGCGKGWGVAALAGSIIDKRYNECTLNLYLVNFLSLLFVKRLLKKGIVSFKLISPGTRGETNVFNFQIQFDCCLILRVRRACAHGILS